MISAILVRLVAYGLGLGADPHLIRESASARKAALTEFFFEEAVPIHELNMAGVPECVFVLRASPKKQKHVTHLRHGRGLLFVDVAAGPHCGLGVGSHVPLYVTQRDVIELKGVSDGAQLVRHLVSKFVGGGYAGVHDLDSNVEFPVVVNFDGGPNNARVSPQLPLGISIRAGDELTRGPPQQGRINGQSSGYEAQHHREKSDGIGHEPLPKGFWL
jgi:hypothetical protein